MTNPDLHRERMTAVYQFIEKFQQEHRQTPTIEAIAAGLDWTRGKAYFWLVRLEVHGWIERSKSRHGILLKGMKEVEAK
jgi:hypothetical protein